MDKTISPHPLTQALMAALGNKSPNKKQIRVMDSLLWQVGTRIDLFFDSRLNKREIECLHLAALEHCSAATATILKISNRTVERYHTTIKRKLNCKNMAQAVKEGIKIWTY